MLLLFTIDILSLRVRPLLIRYTSARSDDEWNGKVSPIDLPRYTLRP